MPNSAYPRHASLGAGPGHFSDAIIRKVLRLSFFHRLENQVRHEFRLVTIRVIGRGATTDRPPHPVVTEVGGRDEWVNLTDHDAVPLQLGARRETESKKCAF